jgi:uncharacterized membrane protein YeaQ/YmgE (transglycosylase-associated protein family)
VISFIIGWVLTGLIVGALGRLIVPGRTRMGIGQTIVVGIVGSFLGGLIGRLIGLRLLATYGAAFVLGVLSTAVIVYFIQRKRPATADDD